ncbi:MAG: DUF2914 domain-containing protein [Deltaproteobacteria bacterium]|nr:DUF2914 domain-containing protein [Deltaproteobacteria bacterium]
MKRNTVIVFTVLGMLVLAGGCQSENAQAATTDVQEMDFVVTEPGKDASGEEMLRVKVTDTAEAKKQSSMDPVLMEAEDVFLNSIILAKGVHQREPVEPGTSFSVADGTKIYAILDVHNATEAPAELSVSWKLPASDREIGTTAVEAKPAKSWRTWSFTRWAKKVGVWEVIVRNANGDIIARAPFEVVE